MGQYHIIVNLDKHEFLNPWDMGEGAKLMEWGYGSGTMLTALAILLAISNGRGGGDYHGDEKDPSLHEWVGRWGGDRIAVVGDYAEDGDLPAEFHAGDIWRACSNARDGWRPLEERIVGLEADSKKWREEDSPYLKKHIAQERRVETMPRFTNISADMCHVIEADNIT
jgi:hypothetical protein